MMRILKTCTALALTFGLLAGNFGVPAEATGISLSGTVATGTAQITTLSLIPEGKTAPIETRQVKDGKYGFVDLEQGVYTLKAENELCVTRSYTVTVGEETAEQEIQLYRPGDVTQDGKLNVLDTAKIYAHVKNATPLTDDYVLACADVTGDGKINIIDTASAYAKVRDPQSEPTPQPEPDYPVPSSPVVDNADEPIDIGSVLEFDAPVQAGHLAHYWLYRISDTSLTIADPNVYVIYNGVTYTPKDGVLTIDNLHTDSTQIPVKLAIGNKSQVDKVFAAVLTYPEGHRMNPIPLSNGNLTTKCEEGDSQGVYYTFTAPSDGKITVTVKSVTGAAACNVTLTSDSVIGGTRSESTEESGKNSVSLELTAGESVMVSIVVCPENGFNYPAATINTTVRFR